MNNVIPLRPDPLRNLHELIDTIHDTNPTPEQKRITDEALALVQKMIEIREAPDILSTPQHVIEEKFNEKFGFRECITELQGQINRHNLETFRRNFDRGEDDLPAS